MHRPPMIVRVIVVLVVIAAAAYWFISSNNSSADGALTASGTIEAVEIKVSPELGGRVAEVMVAAGDNVEAGQVVVRLDTTLLEGQLAQAQAGLAAANVPIWGTPPESIDLAEDRGRFGDDAPAGRPSP